MNNGNSQLTMESFRGGFFARITRSLTAFFFTFVFYLNPTSLAVADEINKKERYDVALEAAQELTPEMRLSHRMAKLYEKVVQDIPHASQERDANKNWFSRTVSNVFGNSPVTDSEIAELKSLKLSVKNAYEEAITIFEKENSLVATKAQGEGRPLKAEVIQIINERHQKALTLLKERHEVTQQNLDNLVNANSNAMQRNALDKLTQDLEAHQSKRSHTPATPDQLPWSTPDDKVREPVSNQSDLNAALNINPYAKYAQLAQAGDVDMATIGQALAVATQQQLITELGESVEIQFTPSIKEKAASLHNNPSEIYAWVHNNIKYIPSHGSIQGAQVTLDTLQGNAIDTSSLLIALLRAANIPARYAYGTIVVPSEQVMNWVGGAKVPEAAQQILGQGGVPSIGIIEGGRVAYIKLEHVWVEAWVDYFPGRGIKGHNGDNWIPMDASFKQYNYSEGMNLKNDSGLNGQAFVNAVKSNATVNDADGWVQNVSQVAIEQQLVALQNQLKSFIENQNPNATLGQALGLQKISVIPARSLSAGLPYDHILTSQTFAEVPDSLRHKFSYDLATQSYGYEGDAIIHILEPTAKLAGKTLSLSFKPSGQADKDIIAASLPKPGSDGRIDMTKFPKKLPGYLINMTAEFMINDEVVLRAPAGTMGGELSEIMGVWSPKQGWSTSSNKPVIGEFRVIGLDLQGASATQAEMLREKLKKTKAKLENGNPTELDSLTGQDVVGDLLYSTIFNYFALNDLQDQISSQSSGILNYRLPSYGTFSSSLQTQYWYGIPRDVMTGGLTMDMDRMASQRVSRSNNAQETIIFSQNTGARMSAMEHLVPEQMFTNSQDRADGISAVKALAIASQQGQKIWTITKANVNLALDNISLGSDTENDIRSAVAAGKIVSAHEQKLNFHGWIGAGYTIIDPLTGSGAYMIAGGANGGFLSDNASVGWGFFAFALGLIGAGFAAPLLVFISAIIVAIVTIDMVMDYAAIDHKCDGLQYLMLLSIIAAVVGIFVGPALAIVWMVVGLLSGSGAITVAGSSACKP
ncbi:MAG: transglutaminase domain-containing protein [Gammaproteobacteria bacterium]|nr:MAG: transglutaminase domain-containing protein [Gammaproteobacteria bacterium]